MNIRPTDIGRKVRWNYRKDPRYAERIVNPRYLDGEGKIVGFVEAGEVPTEHQQMLFNPDYPAKDRATKTDRVIIHGEAHRIVVMPSPVWWAIDPA